MLMCSNFNFKNLPADDGDDADSGIEDESVSCFGHSLVSRFWVF